MQRLVNTRFLTFPALEKFDMIKGFYFFIHISFAIIITYLPAYMSASGYSGKQIALLMSIGFVLAFFVPLLFGILADRTQRPALIMRILLLLTVISLIPFLTPGLGYSLLLGAYFFYAFFHVPVMGIADSMATAKAKEKGSDYGKIRMWAALGWFLAASGFGIIMDFLGFGPESPWLFVVLIISFCLVFLISLTLREREPQKKDRLKLSEVKVFFRNRSFTIFLIAVIFHYISLAPFGQFVGPLVQELGMSQSVLGMTAGMATGIEVLVLLAFGWLSRKLRLETILLMAVVVTGIRWFLVSIVTTAVPLILVQGLHGATAGLFIAGAVTMVGNLAPKGMKVSGQMLFGLAGAGIGNLIGTNLAGILFDYFGSIQRTFLVAAFIEIIPAILFIYLIITNKKTKESETNSENPEVKQTS
jgi:MFS transporter, PPP family, 3-phenylpropionic acid transporter